MGLADTPRANRLHIGIFGRRNSGKSSLLNALTGQSVAAVSPVAGTTTDPVYKAMEVHGIGPVVFVDTAGFDDMGELGELRVGKTQDAAKSIDIALLLFDDGDIGEELAWMKNFREAKTAVVPVISKADQRSDGGRHLAALVQKAAGTRPVLVSASERSGLDGLRGEIIRKIPEDYEGADPGTTIESIEFRNVSFAYKDTPVLKDLNMKFEGGNTYALVGHNGAGKSTIIKLLLRFYDPTEGEILLNGHNIKEYNLHKYRALFATAFQDNRMFSMSVADNVTLGEDIPADQREAIVADALKLSGVYDKVMSLPQGINTTLTREFDDNGAVLSGGEFQKIVVSRAFARRCPIKVFDEPSSALDPIAEYQLFDNILKACRENTLLFISHRLSSVQNADHVFLLEHGQVKEEGTHRELMNKQGLYADMYQKQAENYLADKTKQTEGIWA